ncbi:MAG: PHP domain-containing protein [Clostridia bacterium]|nr:PHP domain-containing protein [Clostridia bacterium]
MKYCDLHNHSVYSDGTYTPRELLEYAKEKGLLAIALTDHNCVDGADELEKYAKEIGIEAVVGSELTTEYKGKETHLLALFIDEGAREEMKEFFKERKRLKSQSNEQLAKALIKGGYEIDFEGMKKEYKSINRAHFSKELVKKGYVKDSNEAFATLLKEGNGFYVSCPRPGLLDTIEWVRSIGALPVLAHPLLSLESDEVEELLPLAKEKGLCGIECYYGLFTPEQVEYLCQLADKHGLIKSGGSDFHGSMKEGVDLGYANVPYSAYLKLRNEILKPSP